MGSIGGRFARREAVGRAGDLVAGLASDLDRKNCWTIAEWAGHATPDGLQHLLAGAVWDADGVRDDLRRYVIDRLVAAGERPVLVVDETGDLKKGDCSAGVQRQYTGTAGRVENAQVAVYLALVTRRGHALVDRALYLPKSWAKDRDRCRAAGVPDEVGFATKPAQAGEMIGRAVDAGLDVGAVTADEVYGNHPGLRASLRRRGIAYVLAVGSNHRATPAGADKSDRVDQLPAHAEELAWWRLSAGPGSKGQRFYSWARIRLEAESGSPKGRDWLLVRCNDTTGEIAYYRCWSPERVSLYDLARVAGQRWRIEESFQGRQRPRRPRPAPSPHLGFLAPLDHPRHGRPRPAHHARRHHPTTEGETPGLIAMTVAETRRLVNALWRRLPTLEHVLAWSHWRRRHQHRARQAHYRRRGDPTPQPEVRL